MNYMKISMLFLTVCFFTGCEHLHNSKKQGKVLPGTDTAVVGIYIDDKGYPQASVDTVNVIPGQRIFFAGPRRFEIIFKDQRSPVGKLELSSVDGSIVLDIPRDIFERNKTTTTVSAADVSKELIYRYGIRVDGKLTDPIIHISPDSQ